MVTIKFILCLLFAHAAWCDSCDETFSLAIGSYTNHAWFKPSKGKGVYIVDYANDKLTTSRVLNTSLTGHNPVYIAVWKPYIFIANSNLEQGSVTRLYLSSNRNTMFTRTANGSGLLTNHVSVLSSTVAMGTNFLSSFDTYLSKHGVLQVSDSFKVPLNLASEVVANRSLGPMFGQPHPHMVLPYDDGVIVPDAGSDIVWHFRVNATDGKLTKLKQINMSLQDAPRHAAIHPGTKTVYVVGEESLTISVLRPEGCGHGLSVCNRINVLEEKPDEVTLAAVRVTKDGRFLYVSVRYPGTTNGLIAGYRLNPQTGDIQAKLGMWNAFGVHPRDFYVIEKAVFQGRCVSFIAVVHRDSDNLVLIERDRGSGMLRRHPALQHNISSPTSVVPIW